MFIGLNTQACRPGSGVVDLSNAGLESFTVPGVNVHPNGLGRFRFFAPLVYPDDSVPDADPISCSCVTTVGVEDLREALRNSTSEGTLGSLPVTGGIGVRVARVGNY